MQNKFSLFVVLLFLLVVGYLKLTRHTFYSIDNYGVVNWDNFGYYLYLPALFIYDDLKLKNDQVVEEALDQYSLATSYYQANEIENGSRLIQYTSGFAVIYSPAFFIGHAWALLSPKYSIDGFSPPYQIAILVQSFLLLFLGLFYLRRFCLIYFNDLISALILLTLCFGTNFFALASIQIASPHVVLFSAYAILLYYIYRWHQKPSSGNLILISSVGALMALSRPNELLFFLIPIFWLGGQFPDYKTKSRYFLKNPTQLLYAFLPVFLIGLLQPLYWKYISGNWVYDSYLNEDFKLLDPYLYEYLFSFKKGWLLYTPLMIFGLLGFIPFAKQKRQLAIVFGTFTLLNIWILSSWDCWWYAASFGQRSIAQSYPLFALPLGCLFVYLKQSNKYLKFSLASTLILLFLLNLFQTHQFRKSVIHSHGMTKAYYLASFFDLSPDESKKKLLEPDREVKEIPEYENVSRFLLFQESYATLNQQTDTFNGQAFPAEGSLVLSPEVPYSNALQFSFNKFCDTSYAYFKISVRFRSQFSPEENDMGIIARTIDSKSGKIYKYRYYDSKSAEGFKKGEWCQMSALFVPPYLRSKNDSLCFFLYHTGNHPVEIDQFYVEMFDPSKQPKLQGKEFINNYHTLIDRNWRPAYKLVGDKSYEYLDSAYTYSSTLKFSATELIGPQLEFELSGLALNEVKNNVHAVVSILDKKGELLYYDSKKVTSTIKWKKQHFAFNIPANLDKTDTLYSYIWAKSTPYLIRSLTLKSN